MLGILDSAPWERERIECYSRTCVCVCAGIERIRVLYNYLMDINVEETIINTLTTLQPASTSTPPGLSRLSYSMSKGFWKCWVSVAKQHWSRPTFKNFADYCEFNSFTPVCRKYLGCYFGCSGQGRWARPSWMSAPDHYIRLLTWFARLPRRLT